MSFANRAAIPCTALAVLSSLSTQAAQAQTVLEPITITATKREQTDEKVDAAVTVRTADDLQKAGVSTVQDLEKVFPGLEIRARGSQAYPNVSVRGVTSPDFYSPSVQILVDGVPQDSTYFSQNLLNVERVELLRGPQGTLYGSNAYGGVLNIVTRKPDDTTHVTVSGTLSNLYQDTQATVSGAIVPGTLFGEVSVGLGRKLGTIDDLVTGAQDIDDRSDRDFRMKLRYAPAGGPWDVIFTAQHDDLHGNDEVTLSDIHDKHFNSAIFGNPFYDRDVSTVALNASYDFGTSKLTSITSFQDRTLDRLAFQLYQPEDQQTVSQEFRYSFGEGSGGPWSGVIGAFFQGTDFTRDTAVFNTPVGPMGASENGIVTTSYALFGEATYKLTETVDVTGGARFSYDRATIDFDREATVSPFFPPLSFKEEADFTNISPKVAMGWQVDEHNRLYAVVSRGYKPGGFNHAVSSDDDRVPYDPETSTNFEAGWKASLFDNRVQLRTAGYAIYAKDKQIFVAAPDPTAAALGLTVLRNLGDTRSIGVEGELSARPVESVKVTVGATYGQSVFVDAVDPVTGADYDGNRLPYAPDFTAKAVVEYFLPNFGMPGNVSVRGAAQYYSESFFDPGNTLKQGGFPLFDASVDWRLEDGLELSLFADNIADKDYRTFSFGGGGTAFSSVGDGRVIGLRAKKSW